MKELFRTILMTRCNEALKRVLSMDLKTREDHYVNEYRSNYGRFLRYVFARGIRSFLAKKCLSSTLPCYSSIEVGKTIEMVINEEIEINKKKYRVVLTALIDVFDPEEYEAILVKPFEKADQLKKWSEPRTRDLNEMATLEWIRRRIGLEIKRCRLLYISYDGSALEYLVDSVEPKEDVSEAILKNLVEGKLIPANYEEARKEICNKCECVWGSRAEGAKSIDKLVSVGDYLIYLLCFKEEL